MIPPGVLAAGRDAGDSEGAVRWLLSGVVQGVGFRPFVYRLATDLGLRGWVRNCAGQVEVVAAGSQARLQLFDERLISQAPLIARPAIESRESLDDVLADGFRILASDGAGEADIHLPPDYFVCDECLAELNTPTDRRYRYPFINCTQCGPRYTLITALPYDRPNTSMAGFPLCPACRREYTDLHDRRFHAEPIACPVCGPRLIFRRDGASIASTPAALAAAVAALRAGDIVAVKGVGGYHLLCDAANPVSIDRLRCAKRRPHKPLALMFPQRDGLATLRRAVHLEDAEAALLLGPGRPIVLVSRRPDGQLPDAVAPGLREIGVMLPYSPLHHLLLNDFGAALVATSANISGEPVLTEEQAVERRLARVAQAFLHHDRPIVRPADDPVYRSMAGKPRPLRLGRGNAPLELRLPGILDQPVLAVGGHMKNTVCLAWKDRAVVSPHIGDMGSARSLDVFAQVCADLQQLYGVRAQRLVCDAHRGYVTSRWARRQGLAVLEVQHHAAHASALLGERSVASGADNLVFTWDGVGMGDDRTLWGGEALYGRPGNWQRVATWRPFRLPGGEKAGREPWRSAVAIAWELGEERLAAELVDAVFGTAAGDRYALLYQAWQKQLNTPVTTAVGRLFDAAAALTRVCLEASFEGQGPMWLEAMAAGPGDGKVVQLPLTARADGILQTDWQPLMTYLCSASGSLAQRAGVFHDSLAAALVQQALGVAKQRPVGAVGLCGGVFQNRRLVEACVLGLEEQGFKLMLGERVPVNDAGLSYGQVIECASR
jgi:hydrogenase maturation protein HypF